MPGYAKVEQGVDYLMKEKLSAIGGNSTVHLGLLINSELIEQYGTNLVVVKVMKGSEAVLNQEVAIMNTLRHCPFVVKMFGFDQERKCILMKYYAQGSLYDFIFRKNDSKPYSRAAFMPILGDVARALLEMHSRQILHRDIKVFVLFSLDQKTN